jgi:hypothetical protein
LISAATGKTGRTKDLISGAVHDVVERAVSAVGSWLSPWQDLLRDVSEEGAPSRGDIDADDDGEADGEDPPTPAEAPAEAESPVSRSDEEGPVSPDRPGGTREDAARDGMAFEGDRADAQGPGDASSEANPAAASRPGSSSRPSPTGRAGSDRRITGRDRAGEHSDHAPRPSGAKIRR